MNEQPKKRRRRIEHWRNLFPPYEVGKDGFTYKDVQKDFEGWVNPEFFKPLKFDMVCLKTTYKIKLGWWDGYRWDGLRLKEEDEVILWKLQQQDKDG